tara:strand:+ start:293 stop:478 length:186 start_codon:yes stop_codon:yes gene_type:complete
MKLKINLEDGSTLEVKASSMEIDTNCSVFLMNADLGSLKIYEISGDVITIEPISANSIILK